MSEPENTTWQVSRNGALYGPYTTSEMLDHRRTGHIVETDLARSSSLPSWTPVSRLFPLGSNPAITSAFPDPPDLPWWIALILEVVTAFTFFVVWDIVEAVWMKRVRPGSRALLWYIIVAVIFVVDLPASYHSVVHALFNGPPVDAPYTAWLGVLSWTLKIIARFSLRNSICRHFEENEPLLGLRLSWWMTLFFGGLYFQYKFNCINEQKRALRAFALQPIPEAETR